MTARTVTIEKPLPATDRIRPADVIAIRLRPRCDIVKRENQYPFIMPIVFIVPFALLHLAERKVHDEPRKRNLPVLLCSKELAASVMANARAKPSGCPSQGFDVAGLLANIRYANF